MLHVTLKVVHLGSQRGRDQRGCTRCMHFTTSPLDAANVHTLDIVQHQHMAIYGAPSGRFPSVIAKCAHFEPMLWLNTCSPKAPPLHPTI